MFPLIIGLLPAIPHIVMGIEKLFGHGGNGKQKKDAAMAGILAMLTGIGGIAVADKAHINYVDKLIEATVEYFNQNGEFNHTPPTP
jgi:hypothetical protein